MTTRGSDTGLREAEPFAPADPAVVQGALCAEPRSDSAT